MKTINYIIKDKEGIHARPAGILVSEAKKFDSSIVLYFEDKEADVKRIFALMGLGIKYGSKIKIEINGEDEEIACDNITKVLNENL